MAAFDIISRGTDDRKVVAATGTPERLTATATACAGVWVTAESDNTGVIAVGFSNAVRAALTSQKGILLGARERVFLPVEDVSTLWIDASVSGDGVAYSVVFRTQA